MFTVYINDIFVAGCPDYQAAMTKAQSHMTPHVFPHKIEIRKDGRVIFVISEEAQRAGESLCSAT